MLKFLQTCIADKQSIFTLNPQNKHAYIEQRFILQRLANIIPDFKQSLIDISFLVEQMRRKKSNRELEMLYKAIDITIDANFVLAKEMRDGIIEYELEVLSNYIFVFKG